MNDIMKPAAKSGTRRTAMKFATVIMALLLGNFAAGAGTPTCQRELGGTDLALIRSVLHLRAVAHAPEGQQCVAYRQHVTTVSKVREVFERCLSGANRETDLRQLDGALDDANGVIVRVCELTQNSRAAPFRSGGPALRQSLHAEVGDLEH